MFYAYIHQYCNLNTSHVCKRNSLNKLDIKLEYTKVIPKCSKYFFIYFNTSKYIHVVELSLT